MSDLPLPTPAFGPVPISAGEGEFVVAAGDPTVLVVVGRPRTGGDNDVLGGNEQDRGERRRSGHAASTTRAKIQRKGHTYKPAHAGEATPFELKSHHQHHHPPPPPSLAHRMASFVKTLAVCSLLAFVSVNASRVSHNGNPATRQTSSPTVTVKNGTYQGVYSPGYDQDFFLGMRYAQPAERFKIAQPLNTTWDDTALATAYPPHCIGYGSDDTGYALSEDCLYLNVIRPAGTNASSNLPVAVWIHGGGLYMGGSADKRYNLSFIVENSVALGTPIVAVSLNYRLSAFGFLCGSEALAAGITNNGFRDQRLALRWVNENVAAFGGDPAKVTIWGESSGAESLNAQVLAYNGRDDGLFRAAVAESGFGGTLPRYAGGFNATADMQAVYNLLLSNTSCASTVNTSASLDCLRALPFAELDAALNGTSASPWPPVLDGDFIADYPVNQLAAGRFPPVAILIGTNADEGTAFGDDRGPNDTSVSTDAEMRYAVADIIGPEAPEWSGKSLDELLDEALALYPNIQAVGVPSIDKFPLIEPNDTIATELGLQYRRTSAFFGDFVMHYLRRRANIAWSNAGLPSYAYVFDVTVNGVPDYVAATHFQEVAFVFDNTLGVGYADPNPLGGNQSAAFVALAKQMSNAWVNFFVSLDPNGADGSASPLGFTWPAYNASEGGGVGKSVRFLLNQSVVEWDAWRAEGMEWMTANSLSLFGN